MIRYDFDIMDERIIAEYSADTDYRPRGGWRLWRKPEAGCGKERIITQRKRHAKIRYLDSLISMLIAEGDFPDLEIRMETPEGVITGTLKLERIEKF
jgi:hypothetical protein